VKTPLDQAFAHMNAAPDAAERRLSFYETLLMAELFLALEAPAEGDAIRPKTFALESGETALAFDLETRMEAFLGGSVDYLTLSGRSLVDLLAGKDIALGLNLGEAPSATLLPAEALVWMAGMAANTGTAAERKPVECRTPFGIPQGLAEALDRKFAACAGLATRAVLADVTYAGGETGTLLAVIGALPEAEEALRRAVAETVSFQGKTSVLDVVFLGAADRSVAPLTRAGLCFDFPKPASARPLAAPGSDPENPPKLR